MGGTIEQVKRELEAQSRALRESLVELPELHRDVIADVATEAFATVVRTSPVLTGAYRSEHIVESGAGDTGSPIYESDDRAGPDTVVSARFSEFSDGDGQVVQFDAPDVNAARTAIAGVRPFESFKIVNRRFYAPMLEFGTATMEPRRIYQGAADRAEARITIEAERISRERDR